MVRPTRSCPMSTFCTSFLQTAMRAPNIQVSMPSRLIECGHGESGDVATFTKFKETAMAQILMRPAQRAQAFAQSVPHFASRQSEICFQELRDRQGRTRLFSASSEQISKVL